LLQRANSLSHSTNRKDDLALTTLFSKNSEFGQKSKVLSCRVLCTHDETPWQKNKSSTTWVLPGLISFQISMHFRLFHKIKWSHHFWDFWYPCFSHL
jgi:hypothetical protein